MLAPAARRSFLIIQSSLPEERRPLGRPPYIEVFGEIATTFNLPHGAISGVSNAR
jgi:hypothetical protein